MNEDNNLATFVLNNHSPIRAKLFLEAIETCLTYNVLDIVSDLEQIIYDDTLDTTGIIQACKAHLTSTLKEIARVLGINTYQMVNDFPKLSKILSAIDKSASEYYPDYILENTFLEVEEEDDQSKLYSLVKLIEDLPELEFYDVVHSLSDEMMPQLTAVIRSRVMPEIEADDPAIRLRYMEFIDGRAKGVVTEYIRFGGRIGTMDAETMLQAFSESILELPVADRPYDIVSALLISDEADEDILPLAMEWADYFTDDGSENVLCEREVKRLLSEKNNKGD